MLFTCVAPHTKSKWLPIDGFLASNLYFFTCAAPHTKAMGS
jgi:hypothetical protein